MLYGQAVRLFGVRGDCGEPSIRGVADRADVLQLSKSGESAMGRVGRAPSHARHLKQSVDELNHEDVTRAVDLAASLGLFRSLLRNAATVG